VVSDIDAGDIRALRGAPRPRGDRRRASPHAGRAELFAALAGEFAATDAAADPDAYYALIARFDDALDAAVATTTSPRR
jgi:hypothetical protein